MVENIVKCSVVLLFVISAVLCENCVTYDFGEDFENTFNHGNPICDGLAQWNIESYEDSSVKSPHPKSNMFISPSEILSCVSSYTFEMRTSGALEVHVYMNSTSKKDQLVVLANEIRPVGVDAVTGTTILTPLSNTYVDGWQVLRIDLFGTDHFVGYLTFLGVVSPGSRVIVDSFRYIPPTYEDDCYLYDANFVPPTAAPPILPDPANCVTYNFEEKFNDLFNSNRGLCTGFSEWRLHDYASSSIDSPISDSSKFISPHKQISCISSFKFNVQAGGTIEVIAYMESSSNSDQIAVLANQVLDENNDAVTGSAVLTPLHSDYTDGWQSIKIPLSGDRIYTGYISFLGLSSYDSKVLIDSFRYIPPKVEQDKCNIYSYELFPTTTPVPITTPTPTGQNCVTYNFEFGIDDSFDMDNQLCNGYSSWNLGDYHSIAVEGINPESKLFISPNSSSSCISSFIFEMKPEGTVEVNVFMKSVSQYDYVIVLAKKLVLDGVDTVAGLELYYANNSDFVEGWNVLKVSVRDFAAFNGYITLIGSMAEDSLVLIDSFRYIPPNSEGPCNIY